LRKFKDDVLGHFKPTEDILQLNQTITLLSQRIDEDVQKYGTRTSLLKDKYENALYAYYELKGLKMDTIRIREAEELVRRHSILGLHNIGAMFTILLQGYFNYIGLSSQIYQNSSIMTRILKLP
jgi:hypothetical protein